MNGSSAAADRGVELGRDVAGHVRLRRDQACLVELGDQTLLRVRDGAVDYHRDRGVNRRRHVRDAGGQAGRPRSDATLQRADQFQPLPFDARSAGTPLSAGRPATTW